MAYDKKAYQKKWEAENAEKRKEYMQEYMKAYCQSERYKAYRSSEEYKAKRREKRRLAREALMSTEEYKEYKRKKALTAQERKKEYAKKYYTQTIEHKREYWRQYNVDKREVIAEKRKKLYYGNHEKYLEKNRDKARRERKELHHGYVVRTLRQGTRLSNKDIPKELIEVKRLQLLIRRELNEKRK